MSPATIPLSRPPVDDELKQAVVAAMESRQWILGPQCRDFETELARYHLAMNQPAQALAYAERSLARLAGRDVLELARVRVVRAYAVMAQGFHEDSLELCREVVRSLRERGRYRQHMVVWREAAELMVRLGAPDEAINGYRSLADCGGAAEPSWLSAVARIASSRPAPAV